MTTEDLELTQAIKTSKAPERKIRILYLIDKLTPAGTQVNLLEIMKRLDRDRFDPRIIALVEGGELEEEFEAIGIEPIVLQVGKVYGTAGFQALSFLIGYLREEEIDIVQTHFLHADILGTVAAKLVSKVKIISARRDEGFWRTKRQLAINRFLNRYAARVLANSQAVRNAVRQSEELSSRKVEVIYNGVDFDKFFPSQDLRDSIRREFGIKEDEFLVGMVANMRHEVKGHKFLIKAMMHLKKDIPNVKFILVGDGPLRPHLEGYAVRHDVIDQILFVGAQRDINAFLNAMDIVCVPSLSEGFSNTVLEAMAVAKPIVATNVGGNSEAILHGETGFLVRPRDGKMIAEKLFMLIKDEKLRQDFGKAACERAQNEFSILKMTKSYESFYTGLLASPEQTHGKIRSHHRVRKVKRVVSHKTVEPAAPSFEELLERRNSHRFRVLYLIWSLDLGGAERVVMDLAKGLSKKTFKSKVCCLNGKGRYAALLERHGIKVYALNKWPKFDPFLIPRLVRLIKRERIDLVHTHLFSANLWGRLAAKWAKVPVVSTEHGMDTWRRGLHLTLDSLLAPVSKRVIFVSEAVKAFYKSKNISFNGKGRVIYNGINTGDFEKKANGSSIRLSLGLKGTQKVIGIIGRLVPEKAHNDFIRAVQLVSEKHPDAVGLIVGDGELSEPLKKEVKKAGLEGRIIFTGHRDDLPEIYQTLDVFVLCSTREGFPLVVLEAMAARVPIVATAVGGVGELITDQETGVLVSPQKPEVLAQAISSVLENPDLKEQLVKNAYEKVKGQFSVEQMIKNHERLYREVLASC